MIKKIAFLLIISLLLFNCSKEEKNTAIQLDIKSDKEFVEFVIKVNNLKITDQNKIYKNIDSVTADYSPRTKTFYKNYAKAELATKDSLEFYLKNINTEGHSRNVQDYFHWYNLHKKIPSEGIVDIKLTEKILADIAKGERNNNQWLFLYYNSMAKILFNNRDYKKSKDYFTKFYDNNPTKNTYSVEQLYNQVSFLYAMKMDDLASMKLYQKKVALLAEENKDHFVSATAMDYKAIIHSVSGKQDSAMLYSLKSFNHLKSLEKISVVSYINIATSFLKNKEYDQAIKFAEEGVSFSIKNKDSANMTSLFSSLAEAYEGKKDFKSALKYQKLYGESYKKDVESSQNQKVAEIEQKYNADKKNSEIKGLNERINLNKDVILYQKSIIFSIAIITLSVLGLLYALYRKKVNKARVKHLALENEKLQIEQKVLLLKLNPHFIFNTLSNFQGLVSDNKKDELLNYLGKFARLMRNILHLEKDEYITIKEEIAILEDYLSLQKMRYGNLFEFEIVLDDNCPPDIQFIPPMLIQPFIENSLMHGFRSINYVGKINISFKNSGNQLFIVVEDNGSGSKAIASTEKFGKPSLGTKIIEQRIKLLFNNTNTFLKIVSTSKGYTATIGIPILNDSL